MAQEISATIEGDELVIRLPFDPKGTPSASGKTFVVATSRGNLKINDKDGNPLKVNGKQVTVGVNAYIPK